MSKYLPDITPDERRTGCKVSWLYYRDEATARKEAKIAIHNAHIAASQGYDFGYCSPGSVRPPRPDTFHPDLWEVCTS